MTQQHDPEKRRRIRELLDHALDLPAKDRAAYVRAHLPEGGTQADALGLLAEVEHLDDFLEEPLPLTPKTFRAPLPERIGAYEIERVLGWGSMGVVYLARQATTKRLAALKTMRHDCASPSGVERFQREAQLLSRLNDPGIATIFEVGLADLGSGNQPWFAMEYVDGSALTAYADDKELGPRERVRLLLAAARAVERAHDAGVVHRDLKPDNVLVKADGTVKVLDFGVATNVHEDEAFLTLTATGHIVGTLAYMAPEQARGTNVDRRADVFALGAMLHELLTGQLPFDVHGLLPHDAMRKVAEGHWNRTSIHETLPRDLIAILSTALASEPSRRYAGAGALARDLEAWLADRPIQARPPSITENYARWLRRNWILALTSASVFILVGAGLAFALQNMVERERDQSLALLFSDRVLLEQLTERSESLWPAHSEAIPQFDRWLETSAELASRITRHRGSRKAFENTDALHSLIAEELGAERIRTEVRELVGRIEDFAGPEGLVDEMRKRREQAVRLANETIHSRAEQWQAAIQNVREDLRFHGLDLAPQEGLIPLGPDPRSGLEEFAVWGTGELPSRKSLDDSIRALDGQAVVLVLVPGGEYRIGAQASDPAEPNYRPREIGMHPYHHEEGPFDVRLDPFLIGKFEWTQDQYQRNFGVNPSDWEAGATIRDKKIDALHPAESMSWEEALQLLPRFGLTLPTEAQWEVAARAGTRWACIEGPDPDDLIGHVNWNARVATVAPERFPDDQHYPHMRVGSLEPNPFGLHDVLGNISEFCLDDYKVHYHEAEHRDGDGLVLGQPDGDISRRGGSFALTPLGATVYVRHMELHNDGNTETGIRPARRIHFRQFP